jgi:hypothetical protein
VTRHSTLLFRQTLSTFHRSDVRRAVSLFIHFALSLSLLITDLFAFSLSSGRFRRRLFASRRQLFRCWLLLQFSVLAVGVVCLALWSFRRRCYVRQKFILLESIQGPSSSNYAKNVHFTFSILRSRVRVLGRDESQNQNKDDEQHQELHDSSR